MGWRFGFHGHRFLLRDLSNLKSVNQAYINYFVSDLSNLISHKYRWVSLTSPQTTQSARCPYSPSLPFLAPLSGQYLAPQFVFGGCGQTRRPGEASSAGQWVCSEMARWGSVGASEGLWRNPEEESEQGAISSGHSVSSGSRVSGPDRTDRRWCGGGTDGGTAWGVGGRERVETASETWEGERTPED